jgi:hypothetical protein
MIPKQCVCAIAKKENGCVNAAKKFYHDDLMIGIALFF